MSKKKEVKTVKRNHLLTEHVSFDVTEAFRHLKSSLCVSIPKKVNGEGVAIFLTSPCPEAGKTTVAVNLAITLAQSNKKVLLLDADVRKGRVARYFKINSVPGLADCISGQAALEAVTHVHSENFSYIPCGSHSPRSYELLESDAMKALLDDLKRQYDYIIIDTPPVLLLADALALVPVTDGAIVVCRHRVSHINDIVKTLNSLKFAKANILGTVVNDYTPIGKTNKRTYGRYNYYAYEYKAEKDDVAEEVAATNS